MKKLGFSLLGTAILLIAAIALYVYMLFHTDSTYYNIMNIFFVVLLCGGTVSVLRAPFRYHLFRSEKKKENKETAVPQEPTLPQQ